MTRDERTIGEAEAERRGYERAKAQAVRDLRNVSEFLRVHRAGGGGGPALDVAADAIARMQPEDAP